MGVFIALVIGFGSMIIGFMGEGGHVSALISWTPAVIVFGGTLGSVLLAFPIEYIKNIGKIIKVSFTAKSKDLTTIIAYFSTLAAKVKREGVLSIESEAADSSDVDPFIKKAIQLVVDGESYEMIRDTLELEMDAISERHKTGAAIFNSAGGTAPTMGIVGTVLGLVHVLGGLADADMSQLGASISSAFLATLYGLASANLVFLPIATRLKKIAQKEEMEKELILEAILMIQQGVRPNLINEKLTGFLNGSEIILDSNSIHEGKAVPET